MQRNNSTTMARQLVFSPGLMTVAILLVQAAGLAATAEAQAGRSASLEEVVVTAQKREESLQEIPIAITAMDTATLEELGITDIGGLTGFVPGLVVQPTNGGSVNAAVNIRGSGQTTNNLARKASVAQYTDGVPNSKYYAELLTGVAI